MAIKRKANASAKLITAQTGSAAPLMQLQAPSARRAQTINPNLPAPVEVTGSPKKQNINTSVGEQVNQGLVTAGKKKGSYVHAGVEYTPEMVEGIVQRGDSGATLNPRQRAVYEQYLHDSRGVKTATEVKTDAEIAKEERENAFKVAQAEAKAKADAEAAAAKNAFTAEQMDLNRQSKLDVQAAKDQAAADKAAREQAIKDEQEEQWNGRYGVDTGTRLSKNEKDLIEKGYKAWGYTKSDQDVIDQYDATIERAKASGEYSDEEIAALESQKERVTGKYKKTLIDNPNAPTAEQAYGRTFVDENGIRWATDKDGKLTEINTTPKETPEQKVAARKEELALRRQEREEDAIRARAEKLMTPRTGTVVDPETGFETKSEIPGLDPDAAYKRAMEENEIWKKSLAGKTAAAATAPAAPAPATPTAPAPTLTPEQEEEAKKRGYRGKSYL